ncbi:minor tail protein [Arthrobacter phage Richie]|uniref:Terminase small subunit n=1 Tax=Arthrobacter phage Richie TaxID=2419967 RepID=A0A3G2KIW4_9CAUD|nr:minor tail protein [Arthrobacter phage Richie]AYN58829.1 terminase small subunit [Arthrobacter phage Richie]
MASGGARARSGPAADPSSARSDARGLRYEALPSQGYDGEVPEFPLPRLEVTSTYFDEGQKCTGVDDGASAERFSRENELWCWAWRTPQAAAWALEPWRWQSVADWVRMKAHCETSDASAADRTGLLRLQEQIGLTPSGLKLNGWAIARDEVAPRRAEKETESDSPPTGKRERRLRAVKDGSG